MCSPSNLSGFPKQNWGECPHCGCDLSDRGEGECCKNCLAMEKEMEEYENGQR